MNGSIPSQDCSPPCAESSGAVWIWYQLEICLDGDFCGQCKGKSIRLLPGHCWLIPPETPHHFVSYKKNAEYYTLKFNFDGTVPNLELYDDVTVYHIEAIQRILRNENSPSVFSPSGNEIIEGHLYALLHHFASHAECPPNNESDFIMRLKEEICYHGYRMNVGELVQFCRCSRSQFKYRFKKESQWKGSIKKFIEHVLFEIAQNHLTYSGMSLTKIAELDAFPLPFPVFAFYQNADGILSEEIPEKTPGRLAPPMRIYRNWASAVSRTSAICRNGNSLPQTNSGASFLSSQYSSFPSKSASGTRLQRKSFLLGIFFHGIFP